jgi:hypothetical protein
MPFGPINVIWDVTLGVNTHSCLPVVPGPVIPATLSIEMVATQMWTAGYFCGQNKFTTTVLHNGWQIVLDGHDIGMLIPDVTIPFVNLLYPVMWPFSSRKIMITSSQVKMNGKGVGMAFIPLAPMMTCGDPCTLPSSVSLTSWLHNVHVGFTWGDLLLGWAKAIVSVAIDFVFSKLSPPGSDVTNLGQHLAKAALGKFVPLDGLGWGKKLVSSLTDCLFSLATDQPKIEIKVGWSGILEIGASSQPGDASVGISYFGGADNQGDFGRSAEGHVTRDSEGNVDTHSQGHADGENWDSRDPSGGS